MGEKIESETQSLKRLQYLDLAKAVGMLCVLIGHSFISEKINTVIYAFHMPLFFFISGYLCKPQKSSIKENQSKVWAYSCAICYNHFFYDNIEFDI